MGVVIPEGFGQASIKFQLVGKPTPYVCTFGYKRMPALAPEADTPVLNATAIMNALTSSTTKVFSAQQYTNEYGVLGVDVTETRGGLPNLGTSTQAPVYGNVTTAPSLPPNVAFLVKKGTAMGGRRGRGRWYLPPMMQSESSVSSLGLATGSNVVNQQRLTALLADLSIAYLPMHLLHGPAAVGDFTPIPPPTLVTSLTLQSQVATQRRRLR